MKPNHIPSFFFKLFEWICNPELFEELQGDLEESFEYNIEHFGIAKAKKIYRMEVLKMIRPSVIRYGQFYSKFNHFIMFKNYFKTSLRSLMKNPLSSTINVFGLSVSIGVCLIVYAFIDEDVSIDQFHKHKNEVFLTTVISDWEGQMEQFGQSPAPLGQMLREDFSNIDKVCRVDDAYVVLKYEKKVFHENIRYVDPEFLEMLTFPLKWGVPSSLYDMNSIVFSEEMAIKYFGSNNPIGENILIKFDELSSKTFTITGVAEGFPKAHAIHFDFLINFGNFHTTHPDLDLTNWKKSIRATLVQVHKSADINDIQKEMIKYVKLQNDTDEGHKVSSFSFVSLANLHDQSDQIKGDISFGTSKEGWVILSVMAGFLLILACFNYINIAIVSASKRLKEIGIRKVIGANKQMVVIQFFAENLMITFFAIFVGLFLSVTIFIPWFNELFDKNLVINLIDTNLWFFLASVLLFTGIVSGLYPAFYISKFQVVGILKGSLKFGKKNPLTKIFLCFQLILASITISGGVWFTQNNTFQSNRSWGYDSDEALYVDIPDQSSFDQLKSIMSQNPDILTISGSTHHLGNTFANTLIDRPDRQYQVSQFEVDANYFETMGLKIIEGRFFKKHHQTDLQSLVVNELFVKTLELDQAIGEVFKIDSTRYEIIGVVKDFHNYNFDYKITPAIFKVAVKANYRYLSMKVKEGARKKTYDELQSQWATLFPELPFQGGYQEDVFDSYFNYLDSSAKFMRALAFIAVLLASLGLYGLVSLNVSGRVKEFSIRKVLGARLKNIAVIITRQYILLFVIALSIGAPCSYLLVQTLFDTVFAYHMPMNYSGVVISIILLISVLLITIFTQIRKASQSNPVEGLKVD